MLPAALQGIPMDRLAFIAIAGMGALGYGIYKLVTRPKMPRPTASSAVRGSGTMPTTHADVALCGGKCDRLGRILSAE
jgi:hypothetical protein